MDLDYLLRWNSSFASLLFYFCLYFIRFDLRDKCPATWLGGSNCPSPVVSSFKPSVLRFYSFLKKKKCFAVCDQISSLKCVVFGLEPKTTKELFLFSPSMLFSSCCLKEKRSQIACKCQNENFFGLVHWFCPSWSFFGCEKLQDQSWYRRSQKVLGFYKGELFVLQVVHNCLYCSQLVCLPFAALFSSLSLCPSLSKTHRHARTSLLLCLWGLTGDNDGKEEWWDNTMKKSEGGRNRKEEEGLDRGLENRLKHELSNPSDMKMCKDRKDGEEREMGEELTWKMDNETRFDKEGEK